MAREEEREVTKSLTLGFSKMWFSLKAFFGFFCQHSAPAWVCQIRRMLTHVPPLTKSTIPKSFFLFHHPLAHERVGYLCKYLYLILKPSTE